MKFFTSSCVTASECSQKGRSCRHSPRFLSGSRAHITANSFVGAKGPQTRGSFTRYTLGWHGQDPESLQKEKTRKQRSSCRISLFENSFWGGLGECLRRIGSCFSTVQFSTYLSPTLRIEQNVLSNRTPLWTVLLDVVSRKDRLQRPAPLRKLLLLWKEILRRNGRAAVRQ
jgi:hypothetical protein